MLSCSKRRQSTVYNVELHGFTKVFCFPEFGLDCFFVVAVMAVASVIACNTVFFVPRMLFNFGFEYLLQGRLITFIRFSVTKSPPIFGRLDFAGGRYWD